MNPEINEVEIKNLGLYNRGSAIMIENIPIAKPITTLSIINAIILGIQRPPLDISALSRSILRGIPQKGQNQDPSDISAPHLLHFGITILPQIQISDASSILLFIFILRYILIKKRSRFDLELESKYCF